MTPKEEAQIYQLRQEAFEININSSVDKANTLSYPNYRMLCLDYEGNVVSHEDCLADKS